MSKSRCPFINGSRFCTHRNYSGYYYKHKCPYNDCSKCELWKQSQSELKKDKYLTNPKEPHHTPSKQELGLSKKDSQ